MTAATQFKGSSIALSGPGPLGPRSAGRLGFNPGPGLQLQVLQCNFFCIQRKNAIIGNDCLQDAYYKYQFPPKKISALLISLVDTCIDT